MLHAQIFAYDLAEGGGPWYQYACVSCGCVLEYGNQELLEYLIRSKQQLFCAGCDPLPDCVPLALEGDFVTIGQLTLDVKGSKALGVPLVLFTTQSRS